MKKNEFGSEIKQGTNTKSLKQLDSFYSEFLGVRVSRYEFVIESSHSLPLDRGTDFPKCQICDSDLFLIGIDSSANTPSIKMKRHIISHLSNGQSSFSCYGVNQCIKRGKERLVPVCGTGISPYPTFDEWLDLVGGAHTLRVPIEEYRQDLHDKASSSYSKYVVPFLDEWFSKEINKSNVSGFLNSFKACCENHLFCYNEQNRKTVSSQILKIIGVEIESRPTK